MREGISSSSSCHFNPNRDGKPLQTRNFPVLPREWVVRTSENCAMHLFICSRYAETPPLRKQEVLANVLPLLCCPGDNTALEGCWFDFWADALGHGTYPCFGGELPPHSRVA